MATVAEPLPRKLKRVLAERFPRARIVLERTTPLNKYSGIITWDGFDGLDQVDRQTALWKVLRANLDKDEQLKITAILTMTSSERPS